MSLSLGVRLRIRQSLIPHRIGCLIKSPRLILTTRLEIARGLIATVGENYLMIIDAPDSSLVDCPDKVGRLKG